MALCHASIVADVIGDRVLLPPALLGALEPLLAQSAGRPLLFELRNTRSGRKAYGGVREFSAPDDTVVLPAYLAQALGAHDGDPIRLSATELPRGTYAKLQPLTDAYLRAPDVRALLEAYLRTHFCTLTQGEVLTVQQAGVAFDVLVAELRPQQAVSIIDTELAVDVVPLEGVVSSALSGPLATNLMRPGFPFDGRVEPGTALYLRFVWKEPKPFALKVDKLAGDTNVFASGSVSEPSALDNDWACVDSGSGQVSVLPSDRGFASATGEFFVGVHGYGPAAASVRITVSGVTEDDALQYRQPASAAAVSLGTAEAALPADHYRCDNCRQAVPEMARARHDAFCQRNNVFCAICERVYLRKDEVLHWHCADCGLLMPVAAHRAKHTEVVHGLIACPCGVRLPLDQMRTHRQDVCPERIITCRYCGNRVRAGPLQGHTGLGEHEAYCGSRTADCDVCGQAVQFRVFDAHARLHELEKRNQPPPFTLCHNALCSRPAEAGNGFSLCRFCFSPLYSLSYDPGNEKLRQRLIFKYLAQMTQGCSDRKTCPNTACCRNASPAVSKLDAKAAAAEAERLADASLARTAPFYMCVDATTSQRRKRAEQLAPLGYAVEWCVKALDETEKARRARDSDSDSDDDDEAVMAASTPGRTRKDLMSEAAEWLLRHAPPPRQ